jgi:adenylate kinase
MSILLGPPGSGKGTQAKRLSSALSIPAISTGEILRHECESGSAVGRKVERVLAAGQLVGDELMNEVVAKRLSQNDCEYGWILDGFPRTVTQARFLAGHADGAPLVFDFFLSERELVARLSGRRECAQCGRIFAASAVAACDLDGSSLVQRADDHPAAIRERLRIYRRNADELVRFYRQHNYHRISAARTPDVISRELFRIAGAGHTESAEEYKPLVLARQNFRALLRQTS